MAYRIYDQHGLHFLTFTVVEWVDLFTRPAYKRLLVENFEFYRKKKGLRTHAFVIMTNHIHVIWSSPEAPLSDMIRDFKKWTSVKCLELIQAEPESRREWMLEIFGAAGRANPSNRHYQIWQKGSHPIFLESRRFIQQKLNYIHQNPVRAGIVDDPTTYLYSSASHYANLPCVMKVDELDERWVGSPLD